MDAHVVVGSTLVAGLVVFMVGAGAWRLSYEQPMVEALRAIAADRRRRAWIHLWMLPAMVLTAAGSAAVVVLLEGTTARVLGVMAATGYDVGAVCWMVALVHRLTVVPWAAEVTVSDGAPPAVFPALDRMASWLYGVHMVTAYATAVALGAALLADGELTAAWVGWAGIGWGTTFLAGIVGTRFAGMFNPPFWAHMYTGLLGVVLLVGA